MPERILFQLESFVIVWTLLNQTDCLEDPSWCSVRGYSEQKQNWTLIRFYSIVSPSGKIPSYFGQQEHLDKSNQCIPLLFWNFLYLQTFKNLREVCPEQLSATVRAACVFRCGAFNPYCAEADSRTCWAQFKCLLKPQGFANTKAANHTWRNSLTVWPWGSKNIETRKPKTSAWPLVSRVQGLLVMFLGLSQTIVFFFFPHHSYRPIHPAACRNACALTRSGI